MFDWMEELLLVVVYKLLEAICQLTWGFDKGWLFAIELIDNFRRGLVTRGFTTALDQVAASTIGVSRPVFELALVIGLMLMIMSPIARLRWVNMRKIIMLFFFIPIGLPMLAGAFQDIDSARGDMGSTFYTNIYRRANFDLMPEDGAGNGAGNDIGPIDSFSSNPQYNGIHAVDIAAAYLFAQRSDVFNPSDPLPVAFRQRYFGSAVGAFEGMNTEQRWAQISVSTEGVTRTIYGVILLAFALLEAMINLGFTLTLGLLLIAFMLSLLFAYFSLFESMSVTILKKIADLFLTSWTVSAIQALLLAATVSVAKTGSSTGTLAIGLLALGVELVFLFVSWQAMVSALSGFGIGGGMGLSQGMGLLTAPAAAAANVAAGASRLGLQAGGKALGKGIDAATTLMSRRKDSAIGRDRTPASAPAPARGGYRVGAPASVSSGLAPSTSSDTSPAAPASAETSGAPQEPPAAPTPRDDQQLAKSLERYPVGAARAAALMLDMRRSGQFSEHRRAGLITALKTDHKLNGAQAERYARLLQRRMGHLAPAAPAPALNSQPAT